ncbi:retinoblastoma-binding protein 5 homolog, partial [Hyalella azteca]|uniref:Retinoblastoma-binding protein 5 homolog n=1 Tax=Hyalella azteca TaxID=294128 RepID=A0A8B7P786_HYAAZ
TFGQNYPEEFDGTLDCVSLAVTCAFNRQGALLAVGCNDGRIVIWDFLTRGIAKIISAHVHPVCSLSWSRKGHKLLSVSTDNNVCIWDVLSGDCDVKYRFPSPIMKVQFHPRNDKLFIVCPMRHPVVLLNSDGTHRLLPLDDPADVTLVASFDRRGQHVYCGRCWVVAGSGGDCWVVVVSGGDCWVVVVSGGDCRVVVVSGGDCRVVVWVKCCFSGDAEYICAGSARQHSLYIWERSVGNLVKILH